MAGSHGLSIVKHFQQYSPPFSVLFQILLEKSFDLITWHAFMHWAKNRVAALRAMGLEHQAGFSKYHHLLNRAEWSSLKAAKILFFMLLIFVSDQHPFVMLIGGTLERRHGKKIKAEGLYRDAVRSSQSRVGEVLGLKLAG